MKDKYLTIPFLLCMLVFVLSAIGSGVAFSYSSIYMVPIINVTVIALVIFINEIAQRRRENEES
tara:strand:+ start:3313 stop:3504 length:192 start_codon:yes stop_codon:yes gene_type:complete